MEFLKSLFRVSAINIFTLAVILFEIGYLYQRFVLTHSDFYGELGPITGELARTGLRIVEIVAILAACWLCQQFPKLSIKLSFEWPLVLLVALFCMLVASFPTVNHPDIFVRMTLVATTIFVAVREELVYRYVMQNWLEDKLSPRVRHIGSVLISSIFFTLSHFGAQSLKFFPWILFTSLLLGAIYIVSKKNLLLVIGLHFFADVYLSLFKPTY